MGTALAVFHGRFGRASLYRLNRPLAPHAHREGHLVFRVDGTPGSVIVEGTAHPASEAAAVAVSPWQPHEFYPGDLGEGAVFLTLYIEPRWFLQLAGGVPQAMRFGSSVVALDGPIRKLMRKVARQLADGVVGEAFAGDLHELTHASFEQSWAVRPATEPLVRRRASDYRIRNALRLMNERLTDTCALDRIARDAGLSRPHFYKLFRQTIGVTPNMYLNTLRLEQSITRLTRSDEPVTAIGLDLGFASQASFTRFFCNNIGIAPTDYRRVSSLT